MTKRLTRFVCLLGGIAAITVTMNAQTALVNVHVPFEFAAGGKMLSAGDYMVESPDFSSVLVLRSASKSVALLALTSAPGTATSTARLVFERKGGELFLSGIELPEETFHLTAPFMNLPKIAAKTTSPEMAGTK